MMRLSPLFAGLLFTVLATAASAAAPTKFMPLFVAYQDGKGTALKYPEGVACTPKNGVVVADTGNGRLVRYEIVNDEFKEGLEIKVPQISYPLRVRANSKGELFVLDGVSRKVVRLGADGSFSAMVDPQNLPAPEQYVVRSMAIDRQDNIYLLDILGARVLILDPQGKLVRQLPFPADVGFISDLAVDARGNILLLDSLKAQLFTTSKENAQFKLFAKGLQEYLYFAVNLEIDPQGRLLLVDQNDSAVVMLGQDGSFQGRFLAMGWKAGQLYYPAQACFAEAGLVITDRSNSRVQLLKMQ